jgi:hypothetical protein
VETWAPSGDDDAGAAVEGELDAMAELGTGRREPGGGGELGEGGIALGEVVIDAEHVGVDVDDAATLEVAPASVTE